jgi:cbb3-type cytochrome oxidase maturation protein
LDILLYLIPLALLLGLLWLAGFMWALKNGQFDDPEGAATRILQDDESEGAT